jgi:hypothetical protein
MMSYLAQVYNVMIASPSDVEAERNIVREVIHEWNVIHSEHRHVVLLPVSWESHSSPEMGASPQEIINSQVLDRCDLLVGIFWTRIGTTTGEYASGTAEEIERHVSADKPAMLYFSNKPAHPDTIDMEQYSKLKEFKSSCQSRGLYEVYDNLSDFNKKFFRQLQLKLNESKYFSSPNNEKFRFEVVERSTIEIPQLSTEAKTLLLAASEDKDGTIMFLRNMGGVQFQTHQKHLISCNDRRTTATWEAALHELINEDLLLERGHNGEIFEITSKGYSLADILKGEA